MVKRDREHKVMLDISKEKEQINYIISNALVEIIKSGIKTTKASIGSIEDDIKVMLRALQAKNKIYDYAVLIEPNPGSFNGIIAYSLIDTSSKSCIQDKDKHLYEDTIEFTF
jgi:hypothetical protein